MNCTRCGRDNPQDAVFCAYCAQPLGKPPAQAAQGPQSAQVTQPAYAPYWGPVPAAPYTRSNAMLIVGIVVAVLLGIGLMFALVLGAIMLPVFARAREKAVMASCQSNLKQASLAALMYTQDYDEVFPPGSRWCDVLYPYIRNEMVFNCPGLAKGQRGGYGYNSNLSNIPIDKLRTPEASPLQFDARPGWNVSGLAELLEPRHHGGPNVSYADGHVRWVSPDQQAALQWGPFDKKPPVRSGSPATGQMGKGSRPSTPRIGP